jgi:hypothetical protein
MRTYQRAKEQLKNAADLIKETRPNDKPMIRQYVNDVADSITKDMINCLSWNITEAKRDQYRNWLSLYACRLHP